MEQLVSDPTPTMPRMGITKPTRNETARRKRRQEVTIEILRTKHRVFIAAAGEITRRAKKPVSPETLMALLLEVEADPMDIADLYCFHVPRRSRAERDKSWR